MNKYFKLILSLPNTLLFNIRAFGLRQGIKMPILVSYNVKVKIHRGGGVCAL